MQLGAVRCFLLACAYVPGACLRLHTIAAPIERRMSAAALPHPLPLLAPVLHSLYAATACRIFIANRQCQGNFSKQIHTHTHKHTDAHPPAAAADTHIHTERNICGLWQLERLHFSWLSIFAAHSARFLLLLAISQQAPAVCVWVCLSLLGVCVCF